MKKPLEDVRVLDVSIFGFGPFCSMMLADLGAEVIKIEPPWGEAMRMRPPLYGGSSSSFHSYNLNKKGMAINLKSEKGATIFKELAKISDVVVENYSPGTMDKLGLGYKDIKEVNPKIIYASLSGFGQTDSPWVHRHSFASIAESISGYARMTGDLVDEEGPPIRSPNNFGDFGPAVFASFAIVAALRFRDKTGKGQRVDVSQADCMLSFISGAVTTYLLTGLTTIQRRKKFQSMGRAAGAGGFVKALDGYVMVAAPIGHMTDRLAKLLNVEEVTIESLKEWADTKTVEEVVSKLVEIEVPVSPVLNVDKSVEHPHYLARNMIVEVEHPKAGKMKVPNYPIKLSESPAEITRPAPMLGEHNDEILSTLLNYGEEDIAKLREERVIM